MSGSLFLVVAVAALGSDYGWQPLPGGGVEYIIQIDPHVVDRLKEGIDIISDVPAEVRNIRTCRFTVGSGKLPRISERPVLPELENDLPPYVPPDRPKLPQTPLDKRPDDVPAKLPGGEGTEDGVKPAVMLQGAEPAPSSRETPVPAENLDNAEDEPPPAWLLATLAIGLMSTTAGMVFTGWTAWDYRGRYRRVLEKLTLEERMDLDMAKSGHGE